MHPFVLLEANTALTPSNGFTPGMGALGTPAWGNEQLLRDLELRLGLSAKGHDNRVTRVVRWAARMQELAKSRQPRFYSASFERDPLGTALAVLSMRDSLREGGWDGQELGRDSARLHTVTELEALTTPPMPLGRADRVLRVASALSQRRAPVYAHLTLAYDEKVWPACWRRVFAALRASGTAIHTQAPMKPQAPLETDLGKIQRSLSATSNLEPPCLRGDGTFIRLVAETAFEAAQMAGAVLANLPAKGCVVIRPSEVALIHYACHTHGIPSAGLRSTSPWRPALQVLPLAMELAFEPKDPQRILELLNLADGPFVGAVTRYVTRALMRSPGVGGKAWKEAKERLRRHFTEHDAPNSVALQSVEALATWFEVPGASATDGAPRSMLLEVVGRVHGWLCQRISVNPTDTSLHTALRHCNELSEALKLDARTTLNQVQVRRLTEFVVSEGATLALEPECVGRLTTLTSPQELHAPVESLVWWMFSHHQERTESLPWRMNEQRALTQANIQLPDRERQFLTRANGFRNAVFAAKERLFLITPKTAAGHACSSHPLWDELVARVPLLPADQAAISRVSSEIIGGATHAHVNPEVRTESVEPLRLPRAHTSWQVKYEAPIALERYSSSSLTSLLGCPLQWALTYLAGLQSEEQALTSQHLLNGALGHRLVEVLYELEAFNADPATFALGVGKALDGLFQQEGATLIRPGKAHELNQLRRRLEEAACSLKELLDAGKLRIHSVEKEFEAPWGARQVHGRWDLVLETTSGEPFIIDLKWGFRRYMDVLKAGNALQLALYGHALSGDTAVPIQAAYYSLTARRLFGVAPNVTGVDVVPGPSLSETWRRAAATLPLVETNVSTGRFYVAGVSRALPMLDHLGVPQAQHDQHYTTGREDACRYCRYDGICGKRWETTQ